MPKTSKRVGARRKGISKGGAQATPGVISAPVANAASGRLALLRGLADVKNMRVGYLLGQIVAGNGTDGAAGSIYMTSTVGGIVYRSQAVAIGGSTQTGAIPIAPSDFVWGQTYVNQIMKLFSRKVYHRGAKLVIAPIAAGSSTTQGATIALAPFRGGNNTFLVQAFAANTAAATSRALVLGMKGAVEFPAWQRTEIPLDEYMASPSGGYERTGGQIEMPIANENVYVNTDPNDNGQTVVSGFYVSGLMTAPATVTPLADVYVQLQMSFLDFNAGLTAAQVNLKEGLRLDEKSASPPVVAEPAQAAASGALPLGVPSLARQTGYVVVNQQDYVTAMASDKRPVDKRP